MPRLKDFREAKGLTQKELSEKSGVSLRMIQHYEQGRKPLARAYAVTVITLAKVLGCGPEDLIK